MNPEDAKKLLGGYATGTLTQEERRVLFEAALNDQELFDALAGEQALKEALEMPGAREQLLQAARPQQERPASRWLWALRRPWPWAAAGATALTAVLIFMVVRTEEPTRRQPPRVESVPMPKTAPPAAVRDEATKLSEPARRAAKRTPRQRAPAPEQARAPQAAPAPAPPKPEKEAETRVSAPVAPSQGDGAIAGALSQPRRSAMAARSSAGFSPMSAVARPGLEVTVVRVPEANTLQTSTAFHAGDSIELRLAPPFNGKLYVMRTEDRGADWTLAYSADARAGASRAAPLRLDTAGQTWLVVVLSRAPLVQLAATPPNRDLVDQVRRDASDLALAKPSTASSNVAESEQRLVREIRLTVEP